MSNRSHSPSPPTYAAVLTAAGRGAVATVGVFGPRAYEYVGSCFQSKRAHKFESGQVRYGVWQRREFVDRVGEGLVISIRSTEEIEVHCHGGTAAVKRVLDDLEIHGARIVSAWELLAVRGIRPLELACYRTLSETRTELASSLALAQSRGILRAAFEQIREALAANQVDAARAMLLALRATERVGAHLSKPWSVVIAGPPNVGKSSLMNAIVGWQRAITSEIPGTTRDVVGTEIAVDGWPVRVQDTAGLRSDAEPLEAEGIERMKLAASEADLVLLVADACLGITPAHEQLAREVKSHLLVWNKCDLPEARPPAPQAFVTSSIKSLGISRLLAAMVQKLVPKTPGTSTPLLISAAHSEMVTQLLKRVDAQELDAALADLAAW